MYQPDMAAYQNFISKESRMELAPGPVSDPGLWESL